MNINDTLRIEPIFDHKHGRRFQIIIVNKEKNEHFTTHKDIMGRDYLKLKLGDADLIHLIQELSRYIGRPDSDPKILEARSKKSRLQLVKDED